MPNRSSRDCPALKAGVHGGAFRILNHDNERHVFAYERKQGDRQVVVILNLTGEEQRSVLSEEIAGNFTEYFSAEPTSDQKMKALTNIGVNDYINKFRIEKAVDLLTHTDLSIKRSVLSEEIAGNFTEYFSAEPTSELKEFSLPAHGYRVFVKE